MQIFRAVREGSLACHLRLTESLCVHFPFLCEFGPFLPFISRLQHDNEHVAWQVRDPLLRQGGLMKMSEGGLLLERLHVEEQGRLRNQGALGICTVCLP